MFVWLVKLVAAVKMPLEEAALAAGTWQNLSNLLFLDIFGLHRVKWENVHYALKLKFVILIIRCVTRHHVIIFKSIFVFFFICQA